MLFHDTELAGAVIVEPECRHDERGFFARTWCQREFAAHGLESRLVQCSLSYNRRRGTFRGMHYQLAPNAEAKLVRCATGAIWDVIVDLRPGSRTYGRHLGVELSARNRRMLHIPESFAHGFLTLEDDTEVCYQMSEFHDPDSARGFRWNDPSFAIELPIPVAVIAERDRDYPDYAQPA